MKQKIANALYDIFVQELGADEFHRFSFVWSYCNMPFDDFTILCEDRQRALYRRAPRGLGEVVEATYEPQRQAANQAIRKLARWIGSSPPLDRMAWVNGEIAYA